jgi:hypothetical protein
MIGFAFSKALIHCFGLFFLLLLAVRGMATVSVFATDEKIGR